MKPGDEFTEAWLRRAEELRDRQRAGETLSSEEQYELDTLSRQATTPTPPEVADDPSTPFVDESRRPLLEGGDYLAVQRQRECDEARQWVEGLALRVGKEAALIIITEALRSIRR